jgi:hypothetical protein
MEEEMNECTVFIARDKEGVGHYASTSRDAVESWIGDSGMEIQEVKVPYEIS